MAPNNVSETEPIPRTPEQRVALVHVLTPEFQALDPADFADIHDEVVERASPAALRASLIDSGDRRTPPLRNKDDSGKSVVSYESGEHGLRWVHLSLTPKEFGLFSRHVDMLARTAFNQTLDRRDAKVQKETGDPAAKARTDEDIAAANRASVRQVRGKVPRMQAYMDEELVPRIETVEKFIEMTKHRNLNRGSHETVQAHFEHLRKYVFGDMLDAVGNQRKWTARQAAKAERVLQRRLYIDGRPADRVQNFSAMLELAREYYGHKRAFVLTRIAETNQYLAKNSEAVQDAAEKDAERAREAAE